MPFLFVLGLYLFRSLTSYLLCNIESRFYCVLLIMCFTYTRADCNNNDPVLSLTENYCSGSLIHVCI